ncbi:maestro heat-like repeat-containing protein family member 7 [Anas platyrhynchos]|uniref:maestro heat-like repeat-containing protein family member 7 n=2 Tax=Anas platyrhynchos TaxID=8839 RepID=UPI003AF242D9
MEGAQEPQGDPERSPSPTMPQPPTQTSRPFNLASSPTSEAASEWDEEGGMPPRQPRLAWQETWSSRGSNQPAEDSLLAEDKTPVKAILPVEDSSLAEAISQEVGSSPAQDRRPVEDSLVVEDSGSTQDSKKKSQLLDSSNIWKLRRNSAVQSIRAYVRRKEKGNEEQKIVFLIEICDLCRCVTEKGVPMNLHGFCSKHKLVEHIMALMEKEPVDSLRTEFWQIAMETVALLSNTVPTALHGKRESLLNVCCKSVFFLPPESDMPETERALYAKTMDALDTMLEGFVLSCPITSFNTEMQNMLKVMLDFAGSKNSTVRERAVRRIERLITFIRWYLVTKILENFEIYSEDEPKDFNLCIPILGKLLGHLLLFSSGDDSMGHAALKSLFHMYTVVTEGRECILREDMEKYAKRHQSLEDTTFLFSITSTPCEIAKGFGGHLFPAERLDIILTALEALQDSSIHDKQGAFSVLDAALEDAGYWLTDVPTIMECIRKNLGSIHTASAWQCLDSLLLQLTNVMPRSEVKNLLQFSRPRGSTDLGMWEVILAMPQTLEKVLNIMMEDLPLCNWCTAVTEDTCICRLAMLAQNHISEEDFGNPVHLQSYLKHPSPEMRFLVLKGLCTVSESPEKARKIQVLLPDIVEALQDTNTDMLMKALPVLRNVMAHVERWKASGPALQLAEKLLPLFDHESSQVREHSICLFQAVVKAVLRQRKKEIKRTVHRSLLPLYFHMRDQSESVAKASGEALAVAAKFLRRKELKRLAKTEQTWNIRECLLQQDRGRVEEYLQQSQPYLQATQTNLRLEAVRFIGLAARYCKDQSEEKLDEILSALQPLCNDPNPTVRYTTVQTTKILTSRRYRMSELLSRLLCCC